MSSSPHVHTELPPPTIEEVSDGIFAYTQLDGSWFLNNAGCIRGKRSATVIDSTGTEARARAFHATVCKVTDLPVSMLVNTHSHGDHTHGNFMFAPETAIIGHERCRREMQAAGNAAMALFPMVDFGDCPVEPPTVTFNDPADDLYRCRGSAADLRRAGAHDERYRRMDTGA
jgi:cyclase